MPPGRTSARRVGLYGVLAILLLVATAASSTGALAAKPSRAPRNTSPPTISGTAQQGQTLTAGTGSWNGTQPISYAYQWRRCDTSGGGCADIAGAAAQNYVLTSADVGSTMRVAVTASNSAGSSTATSAQTAVVQGVSSPVAPANTSPPTISGTAQQGQTLTADPGSWSGTQPIAYAYQWRRCYASGGGCADIAGATAQTYTLAAGDVGATIRIAVTASNAGGSSTAVSSQTATVTGGQSAPVNTSPPTISGTPQAGQTLTADPGSWSGTQPITYAYQWQRCSASYAQAVQADAPVAYWRLGETSGTAASDASGHGNVGTYVGGALLGQPGAVSNDTAVAFDGVDDRVSVPDTTALRLNGSFTVEFWAKLTQFTNSFPGLVHKGSSTSTGTGYVIWYGSDGQPVFKRAGVDGRKTSAAGALSSSAFKYYVLTYDASTSTLRWYVNGALDTTYTGVSYPIGTDTSVLELGRGDQYGKQVLDEVALYGSPLTGARVSAHFAAASSGSCSDISGATAKTYTPTSADVGAMIRVAVTATNGSGSGSAISDTTAPVAAQAPSAPSNTSPPTITGTPQAGQQLTADPGTWSGTQPIAYAYQWRRCDTSGGGCADIAGATGQSYALTSADVGSTIRVAVTASNSGGSATATSAPTAPVTAATADPVVMAAGDVACGAQSGTTPCQQAATASVISSASPDAVLALGDLQYECGALSDFQSFYDPTWGAFKTKTDPAPGNHEYQTSTDPANACFGMPSGASGYYTYFGSAASPLDTNCTVACRGYYSFNLGSWHLIALNSNCADVAGGCGVGSPQEQWLRADLAAHTQSCTLAFWHHPLFSSYTSTTSVRPLYQALYDYNADLLLVGHAHNYERFAPQTPSGAVDTARGIREIVVGTGGRSHHAFTTTAANSEVKNGDTFGALRLVLHATSYDWTFVPVPGSTFTDSGTTACH
jgi:Concanavalin A-like lectin/glucanases superfamily/Calcineurin-like phosphoesterase